MQVDVREVGQRLAGHLGPDHDRDDRDVEVVHASHAVVGPVEADRPAAPVAGRPVVEAVAAPEVVGLPRRHRDHDRDRPGRGGRGDDVGDLVLPARRGPQAEHVEARLPAGRVRGQAHVPRRHDGAGLEWLEHRVGLPLAWDQPGPVHELAGPAVVVTDPVRAHPERSLRRRHLELQQGTGRCAHAGGVGLDLAVLGHLRHPPLVRALEPPGRSTGLRSSFVARGRAGVPVAPRLGLRCGMPVRTGLDRRLRLARRCQDDHSDADHAAPPHRATTSVRAAGLFGGW